MAGATAPAVFSWGSAYRLAPRRAMKRDGCQAAHRALSLAEGERPCKTLAACHLKGT